MENTTSTKELIKNAVDMQMKIRLSSLIGENGRPTKTPTSPNIKVIAPNNIVIVIKHLNAFDRVYTSPNGFLIFIISYFHFFLFFYFFSRVPNETEGSIWMARVIHYLYKYYTYCLFIIFSHLQILTHSLNIKN
jgi:hypothetical protein